VAASHTPPGGIIEGINVTPLVDVILVLLVIFLVTAKLVVAPAVPLDLPPAGRSEPVASDFVVSIRASGSLQFAGADITERDLWAAAGAARAKDPELRAVLHVEGDVPHRRVVAVMDHLREAGVHRLAFGVTSVRAASTMRDGSGGAD
jgi:biopolymer transport protein ExbD